MRTVSIKLLLLFFVGKSLRNDCSVFVVFQLNSYQACMTDICHVRT